MIMMLFFFLYYFVVSISSYYAFNPKTKKTEITNELTNILSEIENPTPAMKKNYKMLIDKIK